MHLIYEAQDNEAPNSHPIPSHHMNDPKDEGSGALVAGNQFKAVSVAIDQKFLPN